MGAGEVRSIDVLGALSLAGDLAMGLRAGHGVRATYIGMHIADCLGLSHAERVDLFYAELLMDAGCTAWASQTAAAILGDDIAARRQFFFLTDPTDPRDLIKWLAGYMAAGERLDQRVRRSINFAMHGRDFVTEGLCNTAETAARLARRLGRSDGVQQGLRFVFEQWNGAGPHGLRAQDIPLVSRIVYATLFLEVWHSLGGREEAIRLARGRRARTLDPDVVDAFLRISDSPEFWRVLEDESVAQAVRQLEPESPYRYFNPGPDDLNNVARAFADFADLKSFYAAGHSRRVAALAQRISMAMGMSTDAIETVCLAAYLHDVGLVVVPSFVLHKPKERLGMAEWESLRLHPYHSDRILAGVAAFRSVTDIVAAHHEQPDGGGFPRGLRGEQIPVGARIIAVADAFDELTHSRPEAPALDRVSAFGALRQEAGSRFDAAAVDALGRVLKLPGGPVAAIQADVQAELHPGWPAGLTDREVEVLRLLATGASRREMADRLTVSEHTVRHHLEHIYTKLDVRTRVEATLFALEHNLIS